MKDLENGRITIAGGVLFDLQQWQILEQRDWEWVPRRVDDTEMVLDSSPGQYTMTIRRGDVENRIDSTPKADGITRAMLVLNCHPVFTDRGVQFL